MVIAGPDLGLRELNLGDSRGRCSKISLVVLICSNAVSHRYATRKNVA
jgi:hypothetical protein